MRQALPDDRAVVVVRAVAADNSRRMRDVVFGLAKVYGVQPTMRSVFEGRGRWLVEWEDGPAVSTVRAAVERQLADLASAVRYDRAYGRRELLLGVLRAAPRYGEYRRLDRQLVEALAHEVLGPVGEPWSTATAREVAMVERL